jgi:hypothetical protein
MRCYAQIALAREPPPLISTHVADSGASISLATAEPREAENQRMRHARRNIDRPDAEADRLPQRVSVGKHVCLTDRTSSDATRGSPPLFELLDRRGAEPLFQVLTEREERSAIAIASNEAFSGWTKTFTHPRLCPGIVDRLTFAGQIIETGTQSYGLAHARAQRGHA